MGKQGTAMAKYFGGSTYEDLARAFSRIDDNGDGFVTWDEMVEGAAHYKRTVGGSGDRGDRVDVFFRRVVFEIDAPVAIRTVVEPKADPSLARPAVDTVYLDGDLRVTRGGDGSLFVLTRDADPVPMLTALERKELYGEASQDVVSGAGLGNWSRTTKGVFSSTNARGRE